MNLQCLRKRIIMKNLQKNIKTAKENHVKEKIIKNRLFDKMRFLVECDNQFEIAVRMFY